MIPRIAVALVGLKVAALVVNIGKSMPDSFLLTEKTLLIYEHNFQTNVLLDEVNKEGSWLTIILR